MLQAAGPHFCTGGRYDKRPSKPPSWWVKAQGILGSGFFLNQIRGMSILSISVLHGSSIGGGLLLAMMADYRVATASADFRLGVAPYNLSPVLMATEILPYLVGQNLSIRMYIDDLTVVAQRAAASGLVANVISDR